MLDPQSNPQDANAGDESHDLVSPSDATDREWYDHSGMCGGCGRDACHDGPCAEDICRRCKSRQREGWFCGIYCNATCEHMRDAV